MLVFLKRIARYLLDAFTYSNVWVSCCSFCFTLQAAFFTDVTFNYLLDVAILNAGATFVLYNLQRLYHASLSSTDVRLAWVQAHRRGLFTMIVFVLMGCGGIAWTFLMNDPQLFYLYACLGVLSGFYFLPPFKLRRYGYLKPFYIAFVFAMCGGFFVFAEKGFTITQPQLIYILAQWLWLSAICLPFDIRDREQDHAWHLTTIPIKKGVRFTKHLGFILLGMAVLLFAIAFPLEYIFPFASTVFLSAILLAKTSERQHRYFFSVLLDGLLVLQFILCLWWFN